MAGIENATRRLLPGDVMPLWLGVEQHGRYGQPFCAGRLDDLAGGAT
jgi:hypothetical protein